MSRSQAEHAIRHGEFDETVTRAAPNVAVVLSQDWCPQWTALDAYLAEMAASPEPGGPEVTVFELLYNRVDYFQEFLQLKEARWGNREIPYIRYYRDGRLVAECNYVPRERFLDPFRA